MGAKSTCKTLVKLTTGVDFINILRAQFAFKIPLSSFSLLGVWL